jgi:DNA polymerase III alpha subunit (gram-positive type)
MDLKDFQNVNDDTMPASDVAKAIVGTAKDVGKKGGKKVAQLVDSEFHDESESLEDFFKFLKQFDEPILIIQNAQFDMRFLNTRNPIIKFDNEVIDTKQIAQLFYLPCLQKLAETELQFKEMIDKIGTSDRDNGLISSSLSKIGPVLGINMTGYHDALTDTKLMMQMLQSMIEFLKQHKDLDISKYQSDRIKTIKK